MTDKIDVPDFLIIDLEAELMPLRDLMVYPLPSLSSRDITDIIRRIINSIINLVDIEYQTSLMCVDCKEIYFSHYDIDNQDRIMEVLHKIAISIYNHLNARGMYIGGVFPYEFNMTEDFCRIRLKRTKFASIMTLKEIPSSFRFNI